MVYQETGLLHHIKTIARKGGRPMAAAIIATLPLSAEAAQVALAQSSPFNPNCRVWLKLDGTNEIFTAEIANGITHEQLTVNIMDNINGRLLGTARDIPFTGPGTQFVMWQAPSQAVFQGQAAYSTEVYVNGDRTRSKIFPVICNNSREETFDQIGVTPTPGQPTPVPPPATPTPSATEKPEPTPTQSDTPTPTLTPTITPTPTDRISPPINVGVQVTPTAGSGSPDRGLNDPKVEAALIIAGLAIVAGTAAVAARRR